MARTVILHVGAPKTGTSFVQDLLFSERDRLREQGVLYPAERFDAHFLAALDLMQLPWGGLEAEAVGAWDRLAGEVRAWPGTAIVSHEILATASRAQAARALESFGPDAEVHLVLSARDLVRQIPAEWQENVKHRRTTSYAAFLEGLQDPSRPTVVARWFWGVQEVPDVLDRWGSTLPREHVHLVTVPPAGAPHDLLRERFARVLGLDPADLVAEEEVRTNASLGVAEAAVLRDLNVRIEDVVPNHAYRALVRESLVHQYLSRERSSARLSVPPEVWEWAASLSRRWVADIALRGYDVVGNLDDLLPAPALPFSDPDDAPESERLEVALKALGAMTREAARLIDVEAERAVEIAELHREIERAHSTPVYRLKQRLVARAGSSRIAAKGLGAYRRLRG